MLVRLGLLTICSTACVGSGLKLESDGKTTGTPTGSIHALITRALFDYQDHVDRVQAMRETWGKDPNMNLKFLDFGVDRFETEYRNWCTEKANCPLDLYSTAESEINVPADIVKSELWNLDGHIWAMRQALADPTCQWILIGKDMLALHVRNLRNYLARFDSSQSLVLGNRMGMGGSNLVMASPWGHIFSRGAAQELVDNWEGGLRLREPIYNTDYLRARGGETGYGFGHALGHMRVPVQFVDTRDAEGQDRFLLWPPSRMDKGDWWDSWYPSFRIEKPKAALSPEAFLFFFAGADEIRLLSNFFEYEGETEGFVNEHQRATGQRMYQKTTWEMLSTLKWHNS